MELMEMVRALVILQAAAVVVEVVLAGALVVHPEPLGLGPVVWAVIGPQREMPCFTQLVVVEVLIQLLQVALEAVQSAVQVEALLLQLALQLVTVLEVVVALQEVVVLFPLVVMALLV
jgi:hypothetical protein